LTRGKGAWNNLASPESKEGIMKVLLIGGGGREHALAWAISRSSRLELLRVAPGNAGIARNGELVNIGAEDVDALVAHAVAERYDLTVVGPEAPLVAGLGDRLREAGLAVFGPSAAAARIEGSKVFSKLLMDRHGIPTAGYRVFDRFDAAEEYLRSGEVDYPTVVKADGLAAGKGVIIAADADEAVSTAEGMLSGRSFGAAGERIVVEDLLRGREASFFVLTDGTRFVELATCQDYKRALDGDDGLNTGGMGTYSPSAYLDSTTRSEIVDRIVRPTITGLAAEENPYQGVLYVGLMLTESGPKVLEYNARFGDPETQVLMPRLDGDWLTLLEACATGRLDEVEVRWKREAAVCVVMASGGYPGSYAKGLPMEGVDEADALDDVVVFHAGTKRDEENRYVTAGGRVLGVTALGADLAAARDRAYEAVGRIRWNEEHHRTDIALDALSIHRED
jgi:phosphoribosylamine--glycine ligase